MTHFNLKEIMPAISLIIDQQAVGNLYHGFRVAVVAYHLSEKMGLADKDRIFYEGLLHDIGLFETGEHIFPNNVDLSVQKSRSIFLNHPNIGANILKEMPGMEHAYYSIIGHHEYYDGTGYPRGKKGVEISIGAQVLRVADSFDIFVRQHSEYVRDQLTQFVKHRSGREFSPDVAICLPEIDEKVLINVWKEDALKGSFAELSKNISHPQIDISEDVRNVVLKILCRAIDGKHPYTNRHSYRVGNFAGRMAEKMGLSCEECLRIKFAGYLHDIGKIAIPNAILDKPGPLTGSEWHTMKTHAAISYQIVNSVAYFRDFADMVFASQEEYDGAGYPAGLKGEGIPLGARIIAVADTIDAILSDRSYRRASTIQKAISELQANSGRQFDPAAVQLALGLIANGEWPLVEPFL